jgi:ACS family glucarate transporter-like MFS transporter
MVGLIFCMGVLMFIDRVNISIAATYIMPEYGLSEVQMGWIFSAFVLGYALLQIPGGWLGDRFGPRRVLAGAICWWSLFTALTALAGEWFLTTVLGVVGSFIVVRVLIGIGEAVGPPNYNRLVANWVAPGERGLAWGIAASGSAIGAALTPPLIVWIMVTLGWRAAFYLAGGAGIVLALLCYWLVTDRPAAHPWVNAAELHLIGQSSEPSQAAPPQQVGPVPWRALLARSDLWCLTAAYVPLGYILYIYFSWFYLYLVNVRGFSVLSGGAYSIAPFLAGGLAAPLGGWLSDALSQRCGKRLGRCGIGASCLLLTAGLLWGGAGATDPYVAIALLSVGSAALFLSAGTYWATTIDLARPYAGTVSGFMNMGGNLGGALSPTLTPLLAQRFGWDSALYVAAAFALVGAVFWLGVHPEQAIALGGEASAEATEPGAARAGH